VRGNGSMPEWSFVTVGITERSAYAVVNDVTTAG
jgi:hypothetical protein